MDHKIEEILNKNDSGPEDFEAVRLAVIGNPSIISTAAFERWVHVHRDALNKWNVERGNATC